MCVWNYPISSKEKGHILSRGLLTLGQGNAKAGILSEGMSVLCDWGLGGKALLLSLSEGSLPPPRPRVSYF